MWDLKNKVKEKILSLIYDDIEEEEKNWKAMLEWKKEHQEKELK